MAGQIENLIGPVPPEVELLGRADEWLRDNEIKPLVTPEVIEEHKKNPIGFHSTDLERILWWQRRAALAMTDKFVIVCTKPHKEWCIGVVSGIRGVPPKVLRDECFGSRLDAEHGVFLKRLKVAGLLD